MQRTVALEVPILNDRSMMDLLTESNRNVANSQLALEETTYLLDHLSEKRMPYEPVAELGAKLYGLIQTACQLDPFYHMSFGVFSSIFLQTIESRHRGKGTQGRFWISFLHKYC